MSRHVKLSRQIAIKVTAVVIAGTLISLIGFYGFYLLFLFYWPSQISPIGALLPTSSEVLSMISMMIVGATPALIVAGRISKKIVEPLNSITEGLQKLATGDFSIRAVTKDSYPSEVALLFEDFNRMAERLEFLSKDRMFWNAAIAHELRTPVTILSGRLQALSDGVFEPTQSQFSSLLKQVNGLARLIEDLRIVGLADNGKLDTKFDNIKLAEEIISVVQLFELDLMEVGISPRFELAQGSIRCDPARIRQALAALLENSRKYAIKGNLLIQSVQANGRFYLRVSDDGPGIDESTASTIFEAFQRGNNLCSKDAGGSGLGLAVVRAIAMAHGGSARCYPSRTGGTTFEISWPSQIRPLDPETATY